jgi:hypothetical protein
MTIAELPLLLILPDFRCLTVTVYDSSHTETATFSGPTTIFAIYFSLSPGSIGFKATAPTSLTYFAIKSSWLCSTYYLSSSPTEVWSGARSGGTFSIDNLQDICLFHISGSTTAVTTYYDTERGFDFLDYEYSARTSGGYTGSGSISNSSLDYTAFQWHSNSETVSLFISVNRSSLTSSLPDRRSVGNRTSSIPMILRSQDKTLSPSPIKSRMGEASSDEGRAVVIGVAIGVPTVVLSARRAGQRQVRMVDAPFKLDTPSCTGMFEQEAITQSMRDRERL